RAIFAVVAAVVAFPAGAAELEKEFARCAAMKGELDRLDCYDTIARSRGLVAETSTVSGPGKWRVNVETNPIDDTKTVVLALTADRGQARFGQKPTLILRCRSNTSEAYIIWHDYLGSN